MASYIALAESNVSGNITLDTYSGTYTGKSTGSGTGNTKSAAEAAALDVSNKVLFTQILAELGKLLGKTTLSYTEIQNLIKNNVKANARVYKLLKLKAIASSADGVNYILNKGARIKKDEYVTIEKGQSLVGPAGIPFTNSGVLQIEGTFNIGVSSTKALKEDPIVITTPYTNSSVYNIDSDGYMAIYPGVQFENSADSSCIKNSGVVVNDGTILNSGIGAGVYNYSGGEFYNNPDGVITSEGDNSFIYNQGGTFYNSIAAVINNKAPDRLNASGLVNKSNGIFYNYGSINNSGPASFALNYDGTSTFYNYGGIYNTSNYSSVSVTGGTFNNIQTEGTIYNSGTYSYLFNEPTAVFNNEEGTVNNSGTNSYVQNEGSFINNGPINNTGSGSYTVNTGTWTGNGTCNGNCKI